MKRALPNQRLGRIHAAGEAQAALAGVLFGSAYVATAVALDGFSPPAIGAWRGIVAAAVLIGLVAGFARPRLGLHAVRIGGRRRLLTIALLGGPLFMLGMNYAVAWSGAATSAFVAGLYAVFAASLAPVLLAERLDVRTIIGLVAGLVGAALFAGSPGEDPAGVTAGLGAALAFATYLVLSRRWAEPYGLSSTLIAASNLMMTGFVLTIVALVGGDELIPRATTATAVAAVAWLAAASLVAQLALMAAVRKIPQRSTSVMLLLNPPTAAVLAWLLLSEPFPLTKLLGGLLVLSAVLVVLAPNRHAAPPSPCSGDGPLRRW